MMRKRNKRKYHLRIAAVVILLLAITNTATYRITEQYIQGKENVKARLEAEPELFEQIEKKVLEIIEKGELGNKPSKKKPTESTESDESDGLDFDGENEGIIEEDI